MQDFSDLPQFSLQWSDPVFWNDPTSSSAILSLEMKKTVEHCVVESSHYSMVHISTALTLMK